VIPLPDKQSESRLKLLLQAELIMCILLLIGPQSWKEALSYIEAVVRVWSILITIDKVL